MRMHALLKIGFAASLAACLAVPAFAAEQDVNTDEGTLDQATVEKAFPAKPPYSPYAGRNFPTRPFFGDTHLHTSFSMDAGAFGARLGPKDAYRFAKGEEVIASSGQRAKLSRPLRSEERRVGKECRSLCDWSSDVCSSDLRRLRREARSKGRLSLCQGRGSHRFQRAACEAFTTTQIGRASCRERV